MKILKVKGSDSETLPNLMLWGGGNLMVTAGSWLNTVLYWFAYIMNGYWLIVSPLVHSSVQCWCNVRLNDLRWKFSVYVCNKDYANRKSQWTDTQMHMKFQLYYTNTQMHIIFEFPYNLFPSLLRQRMAPMIIPEVEILHEMP